MQVNGGESYYYYYVMPDGSYGYSQTNPGGDFTPREEYEQPNGYQEGNYGRGTGYTEAEPQYYYDANTGCYYRYDANDILEGNTVSLQQQHAQESGVDPNGNYEGSVEPIAQTQARDEGFFYVPPTSYDDIKYWRGARRWAETPCGGCGEHPCFCIGACLCPWCLIMVQRKRLLLNDWSNYICCAGVCGQHSCCCDCGGCCLMCWEVSCCLPCAFHGNRYMLMKHYSLKPTGCDKCISHVSCVCSIFRCCSNWSPISCDCLYIPVMACFLAQQRYQMEAMNYPKMEAMQ